MKGLIMNLHSLSVSTKVVTLTLLNILEHVIHSIITIIRNDLDFFWCLRCWLRIVSSLL